MVTDEAGSETARPDVIRFAGGTPLTLEEAANRGWPVKPYARPVPAQPGTMGRGSMTLCPESAVALGGLAGNNAHGAGFLEALRRSGKLPQILSCTTGQIYWTAEFLKGTNIQELFEDRMRNYQPSNFLDLPLADDFDLWLKLWPFSGQPIRLAMFEFPRNLALTTIKNIERFWQDPKELSFWRAWAHTLPAQSVARDELNANDIANVLAGEKDVGIVFNSYDFERGIEIVYMNATALDLTGKKVGDANSTKPWIEYEEISVQAVHNALQLYELGFYSNQKVTKVDGAYLRGILLSEIPSRENMIDKIAVIRPQTDKWLGETPVSWAEMHDLRTEVNIQGTYVGERERILLMNRFRNKIRIKEEQDRQPRRIQLLELPMKRERRFFDYVLEHPAVFADSFFDGEQICTML